MPASLRVLVTGGAGFVGAEPGARARAAPSRTGRSSRSTTSGAAARSSTCPGCARPASGSSTATSASRGDLLALDAARGRGRVLGRAVRPRRAPTARPPTSVQHQPAGRLPLPRARRAATAPSSCSSRPAASTPTRRSTRSRYDEAATRFELGGRAAGPRRSAAGVAEAFPLDGARTLYGATKLAAELLVAEYARGLRPAHRRQPVRRDRRAVADGQGRPGRVHPLAPAPLLRPAALPTSATAAGQAGPRPAPRRATWSSCIERPAARPERWAGAIVERRRRARGQPLAARDDRALPRADRHASVAGRRVAGDERPGDVPHLHLGLLARCSRRTDWRPRRSAARGPRRHRSPGSRAHERRRPAFARLDDGMQRRHRHRLGRPRSAPRPSAHFARGGYDVVGVENDMRAHVLRRRRRRRAASPARLVGALRRTFAPARPRHPRRRRRRCGIFARPRAADRARRSTRPRSPRTTGPPRDPADRLRRQRERHAATCSRRPARHAPDATFIFISTNKVYGDLPEPAAARRAATRGSSCRPTTPSRRHRRDDVDRSLDALAVRRLEGRRRPARPGVRPLLRHADRLLPRRLPHRAPATRARSCTASSPT